MSRNEIQFGQSRLGDGHPSIIIAEIGVNHEGSADVCARMIEAAARAGADVVKLQSSDPDEHYLPGTESYNIYTKAKFSDDETSRMFALAKASRVDICTTCGDIPTYQLIQSLDPVCHKISSGMLVHLPMIRKMASSGKPLLFSTGMAELGTVDAAINAAREAGAQDIAVMQCTSLYPCPPEHVNLRVMETYRKRYGVPVGFSDHSLGHEAVIAAVAAGASVIEKHFTLDASREGFDHGISLEPDGFKKMVDAVRRVETMMGSDEKYLSEPEQKKANAVVRRLVARRDIPVGKILDEDDLSLRRTPGQEGLKATEYDVTLGRRTIVAIPRLAVVDSSHLEG